MIHVNYRLMTVTESFPGIEVQVGAAIVVCHPKQHPSPLQKGTATLLTARSSPWSAGTGWSHTRTPESITAHEKARPVLMAEL